MGIVLKFFKKVSILYITKEFILKPQNASIYTKRFNKLKKALISELQVETSDTAVLGWGPESCIVAHDGSLGFSLYFRSESGDLETIIEIVKTPTCYTGGLVGIHVQETNLGHMLDQIDTAIRDGFERIYIRSIEAA